MADPVDIGQGQTGVLERVEHHRHLELAPGPLQLASGGDVVGHPDNGGRATQGAIDPAHDTRPPGSDPTCAAGELGVLR